MINSINSGIGGGGSSISSGRYHASPSSTGGIGITRRQLSSAFATQTASGGDRNTNTNPAAAAAAAVTAGVGEIGINSNQTTIMNSAPSTNGSAHSSLSVGLGGVSRSESMAYAPHRSTRTADKLARIQYLLRTNARVVAAVVAFAFFVVFVLDDGGLSSPGGAVGSLRGGL